MDTAGGQGGEEGALATETDWPLFCPNLQNFNLAYYILPPVSCLGLVCEQFSDVNSLDGA